MAVLLRLRDLKEYGVNNWPTLGRWIKEEGFPAGFYLAKILGLGTRRTVTLGWLAGPRRTHRLK